ncbi:hypothetical protein DN619_26445 [Klebsiella michiganensis]|nr:hypothetical protein DP186_00075 [Enterobacter hormaechei subsp. xiangfangensis]RWT38623.1 hypothetical protein DN619_26445 [Klebsiella michiganensis]
MEMWSVFESYRGAILKSTHLYLIRFLSFILPEITEFFCLELYRGQLSYTQIKRYLGAFEGAHLVQWKLGAPLCH